VVCENRIVVSPPPGSVARRLPASSSYVALLRGVNVGGHGKVPMKELRELFDSLGFLDVRTLIQSGNVIFRAPSKPSPATLEKAIAERFQVTSPVVLRSSSELAEIISSDPFGDTDRAFMHVGFMAASLSEAELAALDVGRFAPERIVASGTEMYFHLPGGMGNSKLASYVNRRLGGSMTVRNWNTVTTLAELSAA
jgi:uncharacterized protein (DUF1697 family)